MAKQITILKYTGRLGNKIGFKRNGNYYERSMPASIRQTSATRRAALRFGRASRTGAMIRRALTSEVHDHNHINRLTSALIPNNLEHLKGFRFNQSTGTARFFTVAPKLFRNGALHIPPQILPAIKGITSLEIKVTGVRVDVTTQEITGKDVALITLIPGQSFAGVVLPLHVSGTGTLLITLQVKGDYKDGPSCNQQHLAADIIEVQESRIRLLKSSYPQQPEKQYLPVAYTRTAVIQRE